MVSFGALHGFLAIYDEPTMMDGAFMLDTKTGLYPTEVNLRAAQG